MDHRRHSAVVLAAVLSCSPPPVAPIAQQTALLAPLAAPAAVSTAAFTSMVVCERCHAAIDADRGGPSSELRGSLVALSARDPYFLAAVRRELQHRPGHATEAVCLSCHAPVGIAEDPGLTLDDVEHGSSDAAKLARDGVGCLGCHARDGAGLRRDRTVDGIQPQPADEAMRVMSKTAVVTRASDMCTSCHTVRIGDFLEQATALEAAGDRSCVDCHMPAAAPRPYSSRPPTSPERAFYAQHLIEGGNVNLLAALDGSDFPGVAITRTGKLLTEQLLRTAASLELARTGDGVRVTVHNLTGHKLPTGFPSRRMWLHAVALDAEGSIVFESGSHRHGAVLVGGRGIRLDLPGVVLPHRTRIASIDQLAIWEAVPADAHGRPTHVLFDAVGFAKDDRIPPAGFVATAETRSIGVAGDPDFRAGSDAVDYVLPATTERFEVELLFQSIPPETLESYRPSDSPEAARFLAIAKAPPAPTAIATATLVVQPAP